MEPSVQPAINEAPEIKPIEIMSTSPSITERLAIIEDTLNLNQNG